MVRSRRPELITDNPPAPQTYRRPKGPDLLPVPIAPREPVLWFAQAMERELLHNDHKGGWESCSIPWLLHRLHQELKELERAIQQGATAGTILSESADAGNFLMMIADRARAQQEES